MSDTETAKKEQTGFALTDPRIIWGLFGVIFAVQVGLAVVQIGDDMVRGHNGWNSAAYQLSARNSLRWDLLFPVQYDSGLTRYPRRVRTHMLR